MTIFSKRALRAAAATVAIGLATSAQIMAARAGDFASADGSIKITGTWTRATPAGAKSAGGFLRITNTGSQSDRLVGGTLVAAGKVEVHEMSMKDGVMKMGPLEQGLEIKPGATVEMKPGGYHVMFIDLKSPINQGDTVDGTLVFERAGTIKVSYGAAAIGAREMGAKDTGHKSH